MFLLEECLKLYKDNFPVEWIDKFSWEDADVENSYTMASMKIKQFQKNCFIYLSKSALSGEYVSSKEKVENVWLPDTENKTFLHSYYSIIYWFILFWKQK